MSFSDTCLVVLVSAVTVIKCVADMWSFVICALTLRLQASVLVCCWHVLMVSGLQSLQLTEMQSCSNGDTNCFLVSRHCGQQLSS
jgi:hypothetical protein